jgi:hypothetical protein
MQISGSLIPQSYPLQLEQRLERDGQVVPFVPQPAQMPLIRRPVLHVQQAEQLDLGRYSEPVRMSLDDRHARRALSAYVSVQQVQAREDLRALIGVDEYA